MSKTMIDVRGLSKSLGGRELFAGLDASMQAGSSWTLTGPSGSGKSTLLNMLGGLEPCTSGDIVVDGISLRSARRSEIAKLRRNTLGFLFQNYALVDQWSVRRNLRLALASAGAKRKEIDALISTSLASVGLKGFESAPVYALSGGEQQRVAMARLIGHGPSIVLADEPTAALDEANGEMVLEHLDNFREQGALVVCTTHSPRVVEWADQELRLGQAV